MTLVWGNYYCAVLVVICCFSHFFYTYYWKWSVKKIDPSTATCLFIQSIIYHNMDSWVFILFFVFNTIQFIFCVQFNIIAILLLLCLKSFYPWALGVLFSLIPVSFWHSSSILNTFCHCMILQAYLVCLQGIPISFTGEWCIKTKPWALKLCLLVLECHCFWAFSAGSIYVF